MRSELKSALLRGRERLSAVRAAGDVERADDGYPLPPPVLIVRVTGEAKSQSWYLASGRDDARAISRLLKEHGVEMDSLRTLLDFGCGCGRIARHWHALQNVEVHGCDYSAEMVAWCDQHLPFLTLHRNELAPPLPYASEEFDLVYAYSVFTHLSEGLQRRWVDEIGRVLRPGGLFLFSTLGRPWAKKALGPPELARFDGGEAVVTDADIAGTNRCLAYHPRHWVERELLTDLEMLDFREHGRGLTGSHDFYLARRPDRPKDRI